MQIRVSRVSSGYDAGSRKYGITRHTSFWRDGVAVCQCAGRRSSPRGRGVGCWCWCWCQADVRRRAVRLSSAAAIGVAEDAVNCTFRAGRRRLGGAAVAMRRRLRAGVSVSQPATDPPSTHTSRHRTRALRTQQDRACSARPRAVLPSTARSVFVPATAGAGTGHACPPHRV